MYQAFLFHFAIAAHLRHVSSVISNVEGVSHTLLRSESVGPHGSHAPDNKKNQKKIERQAVWAEKLERHEHSEHREASQHERSEHRQLLTPREHIQTGYFQDGHVQVHGKTYQEQMQFLRATLEEDIVAEAKKIEPLITASAHTTCKRNTYIADWGSSGARIYLAHKPKTGTTAGTLKGSPPTPSDHFQYYKDTKRTTYPPRPTYPDKANGDKQIKIADWLNLDSSEQSTTTLLTDLKKHLAPGATPMMAAAATAGNRLVRAAAGKAWETLAKSNDKTKVLQKCSSSGKTYTGCQTLPGATEAEYEYLVPYPAFTKHTGMISSGGASLQLSFTVDGAADEAKAQTCKEKINAATNFTVQIEKAAEYLPDKKLLALSWLADRVNYTTEGHDKFLVGGVSEMRGAFDRYIVEKAGKDWTTVITDTVTNGNVGMPEHPCMKGPWPASEEHPKWQYQDWDAKKDPTGGRHTGVVNATYCGDPFGSYYTVLKPNPSATIAGCVKAVREFVLQDFMMKAFHDNACRDLAKKVTKWTGITMFGRYFGDFSGNVNKALMPDPSSTAGIPTGNSGTAEAPGAGWNAGTNTSKLDLSWYPRFFDHALFLQVMNQTGVIHGYVGDSGSEPSIALATDAEWVMTAGQKYEHPLAPGWIKNGADPDGCAPSAVDERAMP
jgi:hypothetical protein